MRISKKESGEMKCTAYNKRFGISAGVFSQKHLYEFASLSPVRTAVKPPPTPSRRTLQISLEKTNKKVGNSYFAVLLWTAKNKE